MDAPIPSKLTFAHAESNLQGVQTNLPGAQSDLPGVAPIPSKCAPTCVKTHLLGAVEKTGIFKVLEPI